MFLFYCLVHFLLPCVYANSFYLQHVGNHSLIPPFDIESGPVGFNLLGDFQLKKHALILNANSGHSSVWSQNPINTKHWHMQLVFRHQNTPISLDERDNDSSGLVFWAIDPKSLQVNLNNHDLHGGPSIFKGIAISFEDEDRISLIVNDGQKPFKSPGEKSIKGGMVYGSCRRSWRNNSLPLYIRIQYFMNSLKIDVDNDDEGQSFTPCIDIRDIYVEEDYITGFSANIDEVELLIMRLGVFLKAASLEDMRQKLLSPDKNSLQDNLALVSKEIGESFAPSSKEKQEKASSSDGEKGRSRANVSQDDMLNYLFKDLREDQVQIKRLLDGEKDFRKQLEIELEKIQNQLKQLANSANGGNGKSGNARDKSNENAQNNGGYITRSSLIGSRIFYISIVSIQLFLLIVFLIAKRHLGGRNKKYIFMPSCVFRRTYSILKSHLDYFKSTLPSNLIKTEDIDAFNIDWTGKFKGKSSLVLMPQNTKEISGILQYCNENNILVTPQGGNTSLVGGSVPRNSNEIILSLRNMNKILGLNEFDGILKVQAGCILEQVGDYLKGYNLEVPWDLGAKGSCTIGGNLATNAGGIHFVRFGPLRSNVLGIEAVLPNGQVLEGMGTCRKDNTGYSLKDLIIGSEGTLAIITAASIQCHSLPKNKKLLIFPFLDDSKFPKLVRCIKNTAGSAISALEFWDCQAQTLMEKSHGKSALLFPKKYPFYILLELLTDQSDNKLMMDLYENLRFEGLVDDGNIIIAQNESEFKRLWSIREEIPLACAQRGSVSKYDVTLPIEFMYELVRQTRKKLPDDQIVTGYGHLGDGNVHLNIPIEPNRLKQITETLDPIIYKWVSERGGSISSEHGIGQIKAPYLSRSKSKVCIDLMKGLKGLFDPKGILNRGKIFD